MFTETSTVAVFSSSTGRNIIFPEDRERNREECRGHDSVSSLASHTGCSSESDPMEQSMKITVVSGGALENQQQPPEHPHKRKQYCWLQRQPAQGPSRKKKGFVLKRANMMVWSPKQDEGACWCSCCRVVVDVDTCNQLGSDKNKNKQHDWRPKLIYENFFSWRRKQGHQ